MKSLSACNLRHSGPQHAHRTGPAHPSFPIVAPLVSSSNAHLNIAGARRDQSQWLTVCNAESSTKSKAAKGKEAKAEKAKEAKADKAREIKAGKEAKAEKAKEAKAGKAKETKSEKVKEAKPEKATEIKEVEETKADTAEEPALVNGNPPPIVSTMAEFDDETDEKSKAGSSGIASGMRLENIAVSFKNQQVLKDCSWEIAVTFKNQQVLKDCSWEVKKGQRVGLVGVNGAGKTTQLQVVMGRISPDSGEIVKAKKNMKIAYLAQEFDVDPSRTVREEFYSVYQIQMKILAMQNTLTTELENVGEDMERMQQILDELDKLQIFAMQNTLTTELENVGEDMERMQQILDELDKLQAKALTMDILAMQNTLTTELENVGEDMERMQQILDELDKLQILAMQNTLTTELENVGDDMERMQQILDELDKLQAKALNMDVTLLDKKIDKMMPELGFKAGDNDRLVLSYSGGWQMRMCLGKMLLQEPDLLLLDEPTNHLDLDAIEWLEKYLKQQDVPMVIVSHDREFLDQLCTKIVETERGMTTTYQGNYTKFTATKNEKTALQWSAWEKQQKELAKQQEIIKRLSGGAQSGRASTAEKTLEHIKAEGLVQKTLVPKNSVSAEKSLVPMKAEKSLEALGRVDPSSASMLMAEKTLERIKADGLIEKPFVPKTIGVAVWLTYWMDGVAEWLTYWIDGEIEYSKEFC
eukprot:gene19983-26697_t